MRTWDESKHKRDARGRFACQNAVIPEMEKGGLFDGAGSEDERKPFINVYLFGGKAKQDNPLIDEALVSELKRRKEKFYEEDILFITKDKTGQIVWLEEGNESAGFKHIYDGHKKDFENRNPTLKTKADLVDYIYEIFTKGNIEYSILKKVNNRMGHEKIFTYNGTYYFISGVGTNGFITNIYPINKRSATSKIRRFKK